MNSVTHIIDRMASGNMTPEMQQWVQQLQQENATLKTQLLSAVNSVTAASTAAARSTVKPSKPSTFNGDHRYGKATSWLLEMENYFRATTCNDPDRTRFAASQLRDNAVIWWDSRKREVTGGDSDSVSWESFKKAFSSHYEPVEAAETARAMLYSLKQNGGVAAYCDLFNRHRTSVHDMSVQDQLFLFKKGLKEELAREVNLHKPDNLMEAMSIATRAEIQSRLTQRSSRRGMHNNGSYNGSSSAGGSTAMDLSNVSAARNEQDDGGSSDANHYDDDGSSNTNEVEANFVRGGFTGRRNGNGGKRVPNLSKEEYIRCRREGMSFK